MAAVLTSYNNIIRRGTIDEMYNEMMRRDSMEEPMDEAYNEILLEAYYYEKMNPQERQEAWEQDHLNELQDVLVRKPLGTPVDNIVRYAQFQEEQLWLDQHEQTMRVYDMQNEDAAQEYHKNQELLLQKQEWEDLAFRLQQIR